MRVNVAKLRGKFVEQGVTQEQVSTAIRIDKSTFSRKMKSDALDFSIGEMHNIVKYLNLTADEAKDIFLSANSQ